MFEHVVDQLGTSVHGYPYILVATFLAGVFASAICPCSIPVGLSVAGTAGSSEAGAHRSGFQIGAAFSGGIVISLTILGAFAGQLGAIATETFGRGWSLIMAAMSLLAAVWAFVSAPAGFKRLHGWRKPGLLGTLVYGLVFGLGTSVVPLLLLLSVAAGTASLAGGIAVAFVFGLGRGLPFLVAGMVGAAITRIPGFGAWNRRLHLFSGLMLLVVSAYFAQVYLAFS